MKKLTLSLILAVLVMAAYSYTSKKYENNNSSTSTSILNNSSVSSKLHSRGGRSSVLNELFSEARKKSDKLDDALEQLSSTITKLKSERKNLENYLSTNSLYYSEAKAEATTISDSNLQQEILDLLTASEKEYKTRSVQVESFIEKIAQKTTAIHDHKSWLKVKVTSSMIQNYQKEEFPMEGSTTKLLKEADKLLNEIKSSTW